MEQPKHIEKWGPRVVEGVQGEFSLERECLDGWVVCGEQYRTSRYGVMSCDTLGVVKLFAVA